ncbi:MAG: cardiolipin synthase [Clostridia bacterium]|nr:cardiolipin synthase [Clostridia bacterium]
MKKVIKVLLSRLMVVGLLMAVQIAVLIILILRLSELFFYFYALFGLISVCVVFYIAGQRSNPSHKLAWTIPILIFPVFGGLLYILFRTSGANKRFRKRIEDSHQRTMPLLGSCGGLIEELGREDKSIANQSCYIANASGFMPYKNSTTQYFPSGENFFIGFMEELKNAKHFIFIEFFIIRQGLMWEAVLKLLEEKVKEGVDVRVMYDDAGCLMSLPYKYDQQLRLKGIKCQVFNPFTPIMEIRMNHRDHRKIVVIDGHTAFTGGINLADEYINLEEKYGHWKDAAIMVKGEAVWNMTVMFLQLWGYLSKTQEDYEAFRPHVYHPEPFESDGYVQPYADSPTDNEPVGENTYLNMIGRAKDYVYIFTPYLVIDNEMVTTLMLAAKSGVDVRIVTPHIPDKWYVFVVTQSYYPVLIEAGVRVFEYTPGFMHSKAFVSDDVLATVGSINLDYRSLYFHFECGVWLYKTKSVLQVKEDFLKTFDECREITLVDCRNVSAFKRLLRGFLRLFAPLM